MADAVMTEAAYLLARDRGTAVYLAAFGQLHGVGEEPRRAQEAGMVRVEVKGVRVQREKAEEARVHLAPEDRTFMMLREADGNGVLEVEIGQAEAFAIGSALEGQKWARPMTHELLAQTLAALGATLQQVTIVDFRDNIYLAEMDLMDRSGDAVVVTARPADAVAVALQTGAPIFVSEALLAEVA